MLSFVQSMYLQANADPLQQQPGCASSVLHLLVLTTRAPHNLSLVGESDVTIFDPFNHGIQCVVVLHNMSSLGTTI